MRPRYWLIGLGFAGLLVAADIAYWQLATTQLRRGFSDWESALRADGWEVGSGAITQGGWPLEAHITVPNMTLRHGAGTIPGSLELAAPAIILSVALSRPDQPRIVLASPVHARVGEMQDLILTGEAMSAAVTLSQQGKLPFTFGGRALRLESADGAWHGTVGRLVLNGAVNQVTAGTHAGPAAEFSMSADTLTLPPSIKWALGPTVSLLSLQGAVVGPIPPSGPITAWADAWRKAGGSLEISHLAVSWGPLVLAASATLALDDSLQPSGSGKAHLVGYAETLDRLASAGFMTRPAATAAKAVLSLMGGTGEADDLLAIDVPLTLQSRTLSMNQLPLLRLPELDWPPAR